MLHEQQLFLYLIFSNKGQDKHGNDWILEMFFKKMEFSILNSYIGVYKLYVQECLLQYCF